MFPHIIKYVTIVPPKRADGFVGQVYKQVKKEMGLIPEAVAMVSSDTVLLGATWAAFREPLLTGKAPRLNKETVAVSVSRLNECPYCVDAHSSMLYGGGKGKVATQLIRGVSGDEVDPSMREIVRWAEMSSNEDTAADAPRPFSADEAPEYLGVLTYFHFLTRMINVLLTGTFLPGPEGVKKVARRVGGIMLGGGVKAVHAPGAAPGLVDTYPLPADLGWAAPAPHIAAAFSQLAAVVEAVPATALAPEAQAMVRDTVAAWRGQPMGMSAAWVEEPLSTLAPEHRAGGRLALLAALAPYQVSEKAVAEYRVDHPADSDLLGTFAFGIFQASRRVGKWAGDSVSV